MIDVDITLSVNDGRRRFDLAARLATDAPFVALYGPSGAGKSLTLQSMAGLVRPSAGHVRIAGRVLFDSASAVDVPAPQRRTGYLFQDFALFPLLSVFDNVAFGLRTWYRRRLAAADRERVMELLAGFGLAGLAASRPSSLSGGQQQRVALARALACQPQVLLLDEPFASLDTMLRQELRAELATLCRQRSIPVLMITHDIEDVLQLADVVCVYEHGRVARQIDLRTLTARDATMRLDGEAQAQFVPGRASVIERILGIDSVVAGSSRLLQP